jgi:hypothetical protein
MNFILKDPSTQFRLWRKQDVGPDAAERRALRDIHRRGGINVPFYSLYTRRVWNADGTLHQIIGPLNLYMAICLGWLVPDPSSPPLLPGMRPQRYIVKAKYVGEDE